MLRIIKEYKSEIGGNPSSMTYYIQQKKWFSWKYITTGNSVLNKPMEFSTFEDAEQYILLNFLKCGVTTIINNVYSYDEYTYGL